MMGWLAVLSRAPLIGSAWSPQLWAVLALWALAGAGGANQLAAAAAFVQALLPATRARAFGVAQSGLYAVQGLAASWPAARWHKAIGARSPSAWPAYWGIAAATMLAMSWTRLRGRPIQAQRGEAEALDA